MTVTLDLPAAALETLTAEAQRRGMTPEQLLAEDARQKYAASVQNERSEPKTGADLLEIWKAEGAFLPADQRDDHQQRARQIRAEAWRRE